jgi:hypothetical protein
VNELVLQNEEKRDELRGILELIGIGLWYVYVYVTALICDLCIYLVEAFELVYFDFGEFVGKC